MQNTDYNTTIKIAKKCEKSVLLKQKIRENMVVSAVNSLASQLDKHSQETDNVIVQSNAIRVLQERDNQEKVLHRNVSSSNTLVNTYQKNQSRSQGFTDRNVYSRNRGQNIDAICRNGSVYGTWGTFVIRGFYDSRRPFPMRQGMYSQRFGAGYTIPNNAYFGQCTRAGFNGRPHNNTYWLEEKWEW